MNKQRLNDIYKNIQIAENGDIESINQLTIDYPFYHLPYVVLAKYYYDTSHYRFEEMLKQAAMRVKDRKELYYYIHGRTTESESSIDPDNFKYEDPEVFSTSEESFRETVVSISDDIPNSNETLPEEKLIVGKEISFKEPDTKINSGIQDFMENFISATDEKSDEFIIENHHENRRLDEIEIDHEPIGEEVTTEFSFSKSFDIKEQQLSQAGKVVEDNSTDIQEETNISEPGPDKISNLRKNPAYNVETFLNEAATVEPNELSVERDFFTWLQHPQYMLRSDDSLAVEKSDKENHKIDLIEKFIHINPQISRPKKEFFNPENMAKKSEVIDLEYVTETLANIYYEQGNQELAIKAYEKLSLQNPSKHAFFAALIDKIRKEKK